MGYFGKQIYNEPMSMYVDPKLDILANSLQAVQKRHDENYAQMSALDLMAHNTKVVAGDKGIKDAALGRLKAQRDAIAASGDYAYAMPKIGAAVRDWGGDENLIAAKENEARIAKAEETRQAMRAAGHIDLDFNPADNWTTIDPTTGQRRQYNSKLEKQLDYDGRAQEVSKLLENTKDLGLTAANVRDYLKHGSITGISDQRVKANLENAITRFMVSPEGDQLKRKLTQIDKMTGDQADDYISDYLLKVGRAQVHQKENVDYQVNSPAMQREGWAREDAQRREDQAREDAADRQLKRDIAAGKKKEDGSDFPESPARAFFNAKETTVTPATLSKIMPVDKDGNFNVDMSQNLVDFGKIGSNIKPADAKFMTAYETYRKELGDKDMSPEKAKEKRYELEDEYEKLQKNVKNGKVYFRDRSIASASNPKGWVEGATLSANDKALAQRRLDETAAKIAKLKALEETSKKEGFKLDDKERYAKLNQDAAAQFGKALQLAGNAKFKVYTNKPNKVNVDGKSYIKGEVTYTQAELNTLMENYKRKDSSGGYSTNSNTIPGWTDDWEDVFIEKGIIKPAGKDEKGNQLYNIPIKYQIQDSPDIHRAFNQGTTTESVYKENATGWEQQKADDDYQAAFIRKYQKPIEAKLRSIKNPALNAEVEKLLYEAAQRGETDLIEEVLRTNQDEILKQFKENGIL